MKTPYADAIGPRDGDFIVMENAFARVTVRREVDEGSGASIFVTGGDCDELGYPSINHAISAAVLSLAEYQAGRAD